MPAPQATLMQQAARLKFTSFNLKVPPNWQEPTGDAAKQYRIAFKQSELNTTPGFPALFQPASLNKYHTDSQKMMIANFGAFIDNICSALCDAWRVWQGAATLQGVVINAVTASVGQVVGPPWLPMLMAKVPKRSPAALKFYNIVASTFADGWQAYTATIKVPSLPWYPAFAACPSPLAPPTPNLPCPLSALTQISVTLDPGFLKTQMVTKLGDPRAPYASELFESIAFAFHQMFTVWQTTTQVTNVLGTGPVPTFASPVVPAGPVVMGVGTMTPGGFL